MGQPKTSTATQSTSPPADVLARYQGLLSRAENVSNQSTVAPFTGLQNQAFEAFGNIPGQYLPGYVASADASGAPISAGAVQNYENPFQKSVIDATTASLDENDAAQRAALRGNAIAQGALGGDRARVAQAELARQQNLARGQTIAGLNATNYSQALAAAQADREAKARQALLYGNAQGIALQGAGAELAAGTAQQDQANKLLASPYNQAQWYSNILGNIAPLQGSTTTKEEPGPNPISQLLGAGVAAAGLFTGNPMLAASGIGSTFGGKGSTGSVPTPSWTNGVGFTGLYGRGGSVKRASGGGISRAREMIAEAADMAHGIMRGYDIGGGVQDYNPALLSLQGSGIAPPQQLGFDPALYSLENVPSIASIEPRFAPPAVVNAAPRGGIAPPMPLGPPDDSGGGVSALAEPPAAEGAGVAPAAARQPSDWSLPLISAGLGIMASKSPFLGTAIGEGGLSGVQAYANQKKAAAAQALSDKEMALKERGVELDAKRLDQQAKDAAARLALESRRVAFAEGQGSSPLGKLEADYKRGLISDDDYKAAKAGLVTSAATEGIPTVPLDDQGRPNVDAQKAFLETLDPSTAALVKGIADYQLDIPKVTSMRGGERERIAKIVQMFDPTFDMSQYAARAAMKKSITSGNYSSAINASNLVIQHLDEVRKAADKLDNGWFTPGNELRNLFLTKGGDPRLKDFKVAADAAGSELARVFKGTGSTSEGEIKEWRENLNAADSPEQIKAAINQATKLLFSRLDTIKTQYKSAMGKPGDFTILTPHSAEILKGYGIDPTTVDPTFKSAVGGGGDQPPMPGARKAQDGNWYVANPGGGWSKVVQ